MPGLGRAIANRLPPRLLDNLFLRVFGLLKVPLISWVGARVLEIDDRRCVIRIPLKRRTKNHLGSLYIGVLSVGADIAGGLLAVRRIRASGEQVSVLFKDLHAEFLRRPEADTLFTCEDGDAIDAMIEETLRTSERVSRPVTVVATTPELSGDEPVARFTMTLSVKHRPRP